MEQNKDRPFYLNYWMFSVHAHFDAKQANVEKHLARVNPADPQRSPTYAAMIESMDDAIGTLLDALGRLQVADNTIIIFTSDNGGVSASSPRSAGSRSPTKPSFSTSRTVPACPTGCPRAVAVHHGDWKLIRIFHGGENGAHRHLRFHLRDDLRERNNLAAQEPQRVQALEARIESFVADTNAIVPIRNPTLDPAAHQPADEGRQKPKATAKAKAK